MIKLTFLRKFLLIIHTNQKSEIFFIAAIFFDKCFNDKVSIIRIQ